EDEELSKYYYHGVSHFLGLDTHDVGTYKERVLEEGMVITIEPGLYIEEESIGIRIEDDILVTKDGYENLSKDIIRTVEEIEGFMSNNNVNVKEDEVVTK
ncbi:M24 family metallopeptidase, partial [Bacillus toyonensis]